MSINENAPDTAPPLCTHPSSVGRGNCTLHGARHTPPGEQSRMRHLATVLSLSAVGALLAVFCDPSTLLILAIPLILIGAGYVFLLPVAAMPFMGFVRACKVHQTPFGLHWMQVCGWAVQAGALLAYVALLSGVIRLLGWR